MTVHTLHVDMVVRDGSRGKPAFRFIRSAAGPGWWRRVRDWHDVSDATCQRLVNLANEWQERGLGVIEANDNGWTFTRR
jgi:hypothetical protein